MTVRTIAVMNQKGGVGKTTVTANIAHALALAGHAVTVMDLDPQGHLVTSLGLSESHEGVAEGLLGDIALENLAIEIRQGLHIIPPGLRLLEIEQLQDGGAKRGSLLRNALEGKFQDQDFVLMDCPPSSGLLLANALSASKELLIPVTGDFLSLQGLSYLLGTIRKFERAMKHKLTLWLTMSRFQVTRRLPREVLAILSTHFPTNILATPVRETAILAECPSYGKTVLEHRPGSRSARDFRRLAKDLHEKRVM